MKPVISIAAFLDVLPARRTLHVPVDRNGRYRLLTKHAKQLGSSLHGIRRHDVHPVLFTVYCLCTLPSHLTIKYVVVYKGQVPNWEAIIKYLILNHIHEILL